MLNYRMPLAWSNNSLAHNLDQVVTNYRFQSAPNNTIREFPDYQYAAASPDELANLLVIHGFEDGTVQIGWRQNGLLERHESLHGMAARYRTHVLHRSLAIPPDRLSQLFARSGRRLRPDVGAWWGDTLGKESRPWRLRRYVFATTSRRVRRKVDEIFEFESDADWVMFKFKWQ